MGYFKINLFLTQLLFVLVDEGSSNACQQFQCQTKTTHLGCLPSFAQPYIYLTLVFNLSDPLTVYLNTILLQVKCASLMHFVGCFIKDKCPFTEKTCGHQTAIHAKLVKGISDSQWTGIFGFAAGAFTLHFHAVLTFHYIHHCLKS